MRKFSLEETTLNDKVCSFKDLSDFVRLVVDEDWDNHSIDCIKSKGAESHIRQNSVTIPNNLAAINHMIYHE